MPNCKNCGRKLILKSKTGYCSQRLCLRAMNKQRRIPVQKIKGICITCGKEYEGNQGHKSGICSNECKRNRKGFKVYFKKCIVCEKMFTTRTLRTCTCSKVCSRQNEYKKSVCIECQKPFMTRHKAIRCKPCNGKYVSYKYRDKALSSRRGRDPLLLKRNQQTKRVYFKTDPFTGNLFTTVMQDAIYELNDGYNVEIKRHVVRLITHYKNNKHLNYCKTCGIKIFTPYGSKMKLCNDCRLESAREGRRRAKYKRRSLTKTIPRINRNIVFNRNNMKCTQCDCDCNKIENDPQQATLDHIMPLAKGGEHSYDNVQLLCRMCNSIKSDSYEFI